MHACVRTFETLPDSTSSAQKHDTHDVAPVGLLSPQNEHGVQGGIDKLVFVSGPAGVDGASVMDASAA